MTNQKEFIDFICGLASKDETALLVKQVKRRKPKGAPQFYDDGTPKPEWVYMAYLPDHKITAGETWYMNTGSFIPKTFKDRPRARLEHITHALAMMIDDVGSDKVTTPLLDPTWIIETSPGNFQWGYAFLLDDQPTKAAFAAAVTAMAKAGYTDPGANSAVRNFRIPGAVHATKDFVARLVEFHPDRLFTLEEILDAHDVTPAETSTLEYRSVPIEDTGGDNVLEWLSGNSFVLSGVSPAGWVDIICPNAGQHSDGRDEAGYRPVDRVFKCLHGHCVDYDSRKFLDYVRSKGGPDAKTGLREELLEKTHRDTLSKLKPTEEFPDEAKIALEQAEIRMISQAEQDTWFDRFAYLLPDDSYFDMKTRREIPRRGFNALFRHIACRSMHTKRPCESSIYYDEGRNAAGPPVLSGLTYAAGEDTLVLMDGETLGNRWRDGRPKINRNAYSDNDAQRWTDLCEWLLPEPAELNHCLDVMAFKLQFPKVKINHAILHGGRSGVGKDTMWAPFLWAVAGPGMANRKIVSNKELSGQWGYQLETEILIINELAEGSGAERRALANMLKPIIAAPPLTININRKMLHTYESLNRLFVLIFSNEHVPISLPSEDRRFGCMKSDQGWVSGAPKDEAEGAAFWHWLQFEGGYEACTAWLWRRDISAFNPAAAPPVTSWKLSMIDNSHTPVESEIIEQIRARESVFAGGAICSPLHRVVANLKRSVVKGDQSVKIHTHALLHALSEAGWVDKGQCHSRDHPSMKQVFVAPEHARMSKSDARRLAEEGDLPAAGSSNIIDMPPRN